MSIFEKLRNSFSGSKKKTEKKKGHVLGTSDGMQIDPMRKIVKKEYYEITLNDETLGCVIPYDNLVIQSVEKGSPAANQGVAPGDTLSMVDNNPVNDLETLKMLLSALERPFQITIGRTPQAAQTGSGSAKTSWSREQETLSSTSGKLIPDMGIMKAIAGTGSGSSDSMTGSKASPPALTADEKDQRREAMIKAAKEREGAWNKKVKGSSAKRGQNVDMRRFRDDDRPVFDHSEAASLGSSNAETQRVVAAAKRGEHSISQSMGYSPFVSHSSTGFTNNVPDSSAFSSTLAQKEGEGDLLSFNNDSFEHLSEDNYTAVDGAFEMLFCSNTDEESVLTAIHTLSKMLSNLADSPLDPKYRKVRLANRAIHERIVIVKGAVEVLEAAGFHPEEHEGESVLVHAETAQNTDKARYVLSRLRELL